MPNVNGGLLDRLYGYFPLFSRDPDDDSALKFDSEQGVVGILPAYADGLTWEAVGPVYRPGDGDPNLLGVPGMLLKAGSYLRLPIGLNLWGVLPNFNNQADSSFALSLWCKEIGNSAAGIIASVGSSPTDPNGLVGFYQGFGGGVDVLTSPLRQRSLTYRSPGIQLTWNGAANPRSDWLNAWHNIVFSYDWSKHLYTIWLDGDCKAVQQTDGGVSQPFFTQNGHTYLSGGDYRGPFFPGLTMVVRDVAYWTRSWTIEDALAMNNGGVGDIYPFTQGRNIIANAIATQAHLEELTVQLSRQRAMAPWLQREASAQERLSDPHVVAAIVAGTYVGDDADIIYRVFWGGVAAWARSVGLPPPPQAIQWGVA